MPQKKLIILDRDGVINYDSDAYIKSPEEWEPIPGSLEAIATLNKLGYIVAIATNQSGVARGYYDLEMLEKIHQKMHQALEPLNGHIDIIAFCPHGPDDGCDCRKPKPGLIFEILKNFPVDPSSVWFVGDSLRDIKAANAAGCKAAFVKTENSEPTLSKEKGAIDAPVFENLADFVNQLIAV